MVGTASRSAVRSNSLMSSRVTSPGDLLADLELLTHRIKVLAHLLASGRWISEAKHGKQATMSLNGGPR